MKKLFTLLLIFSAICAKATSIFIMINKDKIYVAADSRSTVFFKNQNGRLDSITRSICKISHVGSVYFAMAGHGDKIIPDIAKNEFLNSKDLGKSFNSFLISARKMYENKFEEMRIADRSQFLRYKRNGEVCAFSVFGFNTTGPYLTTAYFSISTNESERVQLKVVTSNESIVILGLRDHLNKRTTSLPNNPKGLIYTAEDVVKYEMKFHTAYISAPIDLLELTHYGPIWRRKKSFCD